MKQPAPFHNASPLHQFLMNTLFLYLLCFQAPGTLTARENPKTAPRPPSRNGGVLLQPSGKGLITLPDPKLLTGLEPITHRSLDRVEPVAWINPGKVLMPVSYLPGPLSGDDAVKEAEDEEDPLGYFRERDGGVWFYGDEAGLIFGMVRHRAGDDTILHLYHLGRGVSESYTLWPPYALAPNRPLLAAQRGMLLVVPLFGSREGGWSQMFSESTFIDWAGEREVVMDNSIETTGVRVDGAWSPWPLPRFTSSRGGGFIPYPVAHDRVYPVPVALEDGTVMDIEHGKQEDLLWWWRPRPELAETEAYTIRSELTLGGQALALAARDSEALVIVLVANEGGTALRILPRESWVAPEDVPSEPRGSTIALDHHPWPQGRAALISEELALVADHTGAVHVVSLKEATILLTIQLPAPAIRIASAGNRLIGISLGPDHPALLLGIPRDETRER